MALDAKTSITHPVELNETAGSASERALLISSGSPDGNTDPQNSAAKGSQYWRTDATDDYPPLYVKVDADGADDDWVPVIVEKSEMDHTLEGNLTLDSDKRLYFRDSTDLSIYSDSACKLSITAPSGVDVDKATVGTGTYMTNVMAGSGTITYGALGASVASTACISVTGLTQQHYCIFSPSTMSGCLNITGFCCSPGGGVLQMTATATSSYAGGDVVFSYLAVQACGL